MYYFVIDIVVYAILIDQVNVPQPRARGNGHNIRGQSNVSVNVSY